jgi:NADPH-dependent 2,4-dienoyl-CoA reductase/sulfur reductase-like enzyme
MDGRAEHAVLIVGASMAALRTAESLRGFGYGGRITVVGDEPYLPYNRPPLSKRMLARGVSHDAVAFPLRSDIEDVDWVLGRRAISADLRARTVRTDDGRNLGYDALVVATGLRSRRLPRSSMPPDGCLALRSLDDAAQLRSALVPGSRLVIIGAGFVGCEVAATARGLGCEVTIVAPEALPMLAQLGPALAENLLHRHEEHGVRFLLNTLVRAVRGDRRVTGVELADGMVLECDTVVEAIGSAYNTEWLAGNDLDLSTGVLTDSALRAVRGDGTAWADVHAVGDVARFPNPRYPGPARTVEHWAMPMETARRAARVIAARAVGDAAEYQRAVDEPFEPIPSFWSDQYDAHVIALGLPDLADDIQLLHGEAGDDCVYGYFRDETLVGVCGIGLRAVVHSYRDRLGTHPVSTAGGEPD